MTVTRLPARENARPVPPKRLMRPCDWGLVTAIMQLETQVGTIEAYNRLCEAAAQLHRKIKAGKAEAQNPLYATDPSGRVSPK